MVNCSLLGWLVAQKAVGQKVVMRYRLGKLLSPVDFGLGICLVFGLAAHALAQDERSHVNVYLHTATGATPLSAVIDAQARYLVAYGDCLESLAIARKIHAEAYQIELRNWVDEVDAYFKRRELNRLWRRKENPDYVEHEARRQRALDRQMREQFERFAESDLAGRLNWLLMKLSGPAIGVRHLDAGRSRSISALDTEISDEAKHKIWVTDGGRAGSRLVCRLSDGEILKTPWPPALRRPECDVARASYEAALAKVKEEIRTRQLVTYGSHRQCVDALNVLFATLEDTYSQEDRKDVVLFMEYNSAKNYLRSVMAQLGRTISTSDLSVLSGSLRFEGKTVGELIQHMTERGVLFAPPQAGDEGTYRRLLTDLSNVYVVLSPAPSASVAQQTGSSRP